MQYFWTIHPLSLGRRYQRDEEPWYYNERVKRTREKICQLHMIYISDQILQMQDRKPSGLLVLADGHGCTLDEPDCVICALQHNVFVSTLIKTINSYGKREFVEVNGACQTDENRVQKQRNGARGAGRMHPREAKANSKLTRHQNRSSVQYANTHL